MSKLSKDQQQQWQQQIQAAAAELQPLALALLAYMEDRYLGQIAEQLKKLAITTVDELFASKFFDVIVLFSSRQRAQYIHTLVTRLDGTMFQTNLARRSVRSSDFTLDYLHRYLSLIEEMLTFEEIDLVSFLQNRALYEHGTWPNYNDFVSKQDKSKVLSYDVYELTLAEQLSTGNQAVEALVEEILADEHKGQFFGYGLVRGIMTSTNRRMHEALGRLLLAAARQEGLRQTIVENIDHGNLEAQLSMMKLIQEHQLTRFSSVTRAVDAWMGLGYNSFENQKMTEQALALAIQAVEDQSFAEQLLESERTIDVYIAMWAIATKDYRELGEVLSTLFQREKHIQLTALTFLHNLSLSSFIPPFIKELLLATTDIEVFAFAWQSFITPNWRVNNDYSRDEDWETELYNYVESQPVIKGIEHALFERIEWAKSQINKDGLLIAGKPFSFVHVQLSFESLVSTQLILAYRLQDEELFKRIVADADAYPPASRIGILNIYCLDNTSLDRRQFLFRSLRDRSSTNRTLALKKIMPLTLSSEEIFLVEELLGNKAGALRKDVITLLKQQEQAAILQSVERLVQDSKQLKRLGGLELMLEATKKLDLSAARIQVCCDLLPSITEKEQLFIDQLLVTDMPAYHADNGFGLYTRHAAIQYDSASGKIQQGTAVPAWRQLAAVYQQSPSPLAKFFSYDMEQLWSKCEKLVQQLDARAGEEYQRYLYGGSVFTTTIGDDQYDIVTSKAEYDQQNTGLDAYPLPEVIVQWIKEVGFSTEDMAYYRYYNTLYFPYNDYAEDVMNTLKPFFDYEPVRKHVQRLSELKYRRTFSIIMNLLSQTQVADTYPLHHEALALLHQHSPAFNSFKQGVGIMLQLLEEIPAGQWQVQLYEDNYYASRQNSLLDVEIIGQFAQYLTTAQSDEQLAEMLAVKEELAQRLQQQDGYQPNIYRLSLLQYAAAYRAGLLTNDHLFEGIFTDEIAREMLQSPADIERIYGADAANLSQLLDIRQRAIDRILEIELMRGDTPTAVTVLTHYIRDIEGIPYFLRILQALEGEKLTRGYIYNNADTKKDVFSHLLANCHPKKEETAEQLKAAWQQTSLSQERLIEAMMYNQRWIELVSEVIGWKGLKESAWYFIAHTSDSMSDFAKDQISLFSNITPEDFNDGAFDLHWFQSAYQTLGAKKFKLVYDAAKYASEGANHRRAQLYADTAIGKLKSKALMTEIADKRNKDKLRALGLIPLKQEDEQEALARYQFIQQFIKESKQFGAQRRASEARSASIALENLARNAGDGETTRFTWRMELIAFSSMQPLFEPQQIGQITAYLQLDHQAEVSIIVEKDGKKLQSIPAALKKNEQVLQLQEARKQLQEQYKRARLALEHAMEQAAAFGVEELRRLLAHPVLASLLQKLVWMHGTQLGMLTADGLQLVSGEISPFSAEPLLVAHPYHLLQSGEWRQWQAYLFAAQIKQPFKQVFRELYILNADEQQQTETLRYAGHQVQPKQAIALFKTRSWQISYEYGPRKIYYKQNIVASFYTEADWYTPAEVEAPTIEGVYFYNRLTGKELLLEDVPALIFSEVMRDLDLVVSVAHVGGVDPEATHSTIEMRAVIVEELAKLLKLTNVQVANQHAIIDGKLASYSLHLGSGIVHQRGGSMIPIVAVPSQHRGRIFLPMVDDDPRTAEIMSKLLLLSEDSKIKDPAILGHIRS